MSHFFLNSSFPPLGIYSQVLSQTCREFSAIQAFAYLNWLIRKSSLYSSLTANSDQTTSFRLQYCSPLIQYYGRKPWSRYLDPIRENSRFPWLFSPPSERSTTSYAAAPKYRSITRPVSPSSWCPSRVGWSSPGS